MNGRTEQRCTKTSGHCFPHVLAPEVRVERKHWCIRGIAVWPAVVGVLNNHADSGRRRRRHTANGSTLVPVPCVNGEMMRGIARARMRTAGACRESALFGSFEGCSLPSWAPFPRPSLLASPFALPSPPLTSLHLPRPPLPSHATRLSFALRSSSAALAPLLHHLNTYPRGV